MSVVFDILDRANRNVVLPLHGDGAQTFSGSILYVMDDVGTQFSAVVDPAPEIMPEFLIDHDPREIVTMEVPGVGIIGTFGGIQRPLNSNDVVMFKTTKLKLLRFEANPAEPTTKYWLQKLVAGVDS